MVNKRDKPAVSDSALVGLLCSKASEWGKKLTDPKTHPQSLTNWLKGDSFKAELRLEPDYDRTDNALCISIRLKRVTRGPQLEKIVHIRYATTSRRLDHARTWRRLGGLRKKRRIHRRHEGVSLVGFAREIYWHPSTLEIDLRVQLVIALIQLDLLRDSALDTELQLYVETFRHGISKDIAYAVATDVLEKWSFPEDYRAFRRYVSKQLNLALRRNRFHDADELSDVIRSEEVHHAILETESKIGVLRKPDDEDGGNSIRRAPIPSSAGGFWKVQDASVALRVTPRYIYKLIQKGSLQSKRRDGVVVVPTSEIKRLHAFFAQSELNRTQRKELVSQGIKGETARKRIYRARKRGSLETKDERRIQGMQEGVRQKDEHRRHERR
jgi:hypothetical protein